jgi:hypothetical protein
MIATVNEMITPDLSIIIHRGKDGLFAMEDQRESE